MTSDTAPARGAIRTEARAKHRSAVREPAFRRYLVGQSISLVGNQVWYVALSWIAMFCVVEAVCLFAVAVAPGVALAATSTTLLGLTLGPVNVLATVLEQRETPDEFRGRVASIQLLIGLGLIPMTYGVIIAAIGTTGTFALGALIELSVLLTLLAPAYRRARVED